MVVNGKCKVRAASEVLENAATAEASSFQSSARTPPPVQSPDVVSKKNPATQSVGLSSHVYQLGITIHISMSQANPKTNCLFGPVEFNSN